MDCGAHYQARGNVTALADQFIDHLPDMVWIQLPVATPWGRFGPI